MSANKMKLKQKKVKIPDVLSGNPVIVFTYFDENNPLTDTDGNPLPSNTPDGEGGVLPQYYDFTISIPIEGELPETDAELLALVTSAKAEADVKAKEKASGRIDGIDKVDKLRTIIKDLDKEEVVYEETEMKMASPKKKTTKSKK